MENTEAVRPSAGEAMALQVEYQCWRIHHGCDTGFWQFYQLCDEIERIWGQRDALAAASSVQEETGAEENTSVGERS